MRDFIANASSEMFALEGLSRRQQDMLVEKLSSDNSIPIPDDDMFDELDDCSWRTHFAERNPRQASMPLRKAANTLYRAMKGNKLALDKADVRLLYRSVNASEQGRAINANASDDLCSAAISCIRHNYRQAQDILDHRAPISKL